MTLNLLANILVYCKVEDGMNLLGTCKKFYATKRVFVVVDDSSSYNPNSKNNDKTIMMRMVGNNNNNNVDSPSSSLETKKVNNLNPTTATQIKFQW